MRFVTWRGQFMNSPTKRVWQRNKMTLCDRVGNQLFNFTCKKINRFRYHRKAYIICMFRTFFDLNSLVIKSNCKVQTSRLSILILHQCLLTTLTRDGFGEIASSQIICNEGNLMLLKWQWLFRSWKIELNYDCGGDYIPTRVCPERSSFCTFIMQPSSANMHCLNYNTVWQYGVNDEGQILKSQNGTMSMNKAKLSNFICKLTLTLVSFSFLKIYSFSACEPSKII